MKYNQTILKGTWLIKLERLYIDHYIEHADLTKLGIQALIKSGICIPIDQEINDPYCTIILTKHGKQLLDHFFSKSKIKSNQKRITKNIKRALIIITLGIIWFILNALTIPKKIPFFILPTKYTYHHYQFTQFQIKKIKQLQQSIPTIRQQMVDPHATANIVINILATLVGLLIIGLLITFVIKGSDTQFKIDQANYLMSLKLSLDTLKNDLNQDSHLSWDANFINMYNADIRTNKIHSYQDMHPNEHFSYYLALY